MTLSSTELWRLSDELSVVDAAILISGNDPSEKLERFDDDGQPFRDINGDFEKYQRTNYEGFDPAFKALRNAIFSNELAAIIGAKARDQFFNYGAYGQPEVRLADGEFELKFDALVRASDCERSVFTNRRIENLENAHTMFVLDEPDWTETMVRVEDLKDWLDQRGVYPEFFFPHGKADGFRDKSHPRYSAKLACAIAAWEAVEKAQPKKSVKETITAWVVNNAASFGLANNDGIVPKLSVEEISKVVNWATSGGATPTSSNEPDETPKAATNNFWVSARPDIDDIDDDIPF